MPCPSDSAFEAFAADRLSPTAEQQIVDHLESCQTCRDRSESLCGGPVLDAAKPLASKQAGGGEATGMGDATCAEPQDLRSDLYRLVSGDAELPASPPPSDLLRLLTAEPTDDLAGARLGRFSIRRWLGAGAFGVVFLAYDELLRREVALKLPRVQALARRLVRERFLREAEAAAQLHHPNVVPVFEAGEEQGVCYIASAYCPGPTLDAWLAAQSPPVPVATAVALLRPLAEAVQHAHQHRVLHRDIKPSNILLESNPSSPDVLIPKITDFGLAKLLDTEVSMTASQGMLGTPRYMAPEQATGSGSVGPATDVFALGAVLYELLTGTAPYAAEDQARTLHRLLYEQVVPPRRLRSDVPLDLEAICLKCLERRPADRYTAAQELADDLRRFQEGHATLARPVGRLELLRRWTVRQPAIAALLATVTLCLLITLGVFVAHSRTLSSSNREVQTALSEARIAQRALEEQRGRMHNLLYAAKIALAHQAVEENDLRQASQLLEEIRIENAAVPRSFVWYHLWNQVAARGRQIDRGAADVYELQFTPSGLRVAACGVDGSLRIYDGQTFSRLASWATEQGEINGVAFSPDEQWIATAGDDGTIRLWDARTGQPRRTIEAHRQLAYGVLFTPDGRGLITCGADPVIRLWDIDSGALQGTLEGHSRAVESIAISPDGSQLASASSDATARLWDLKSGKTQHVLRGHDSRVVDARYSSDGRYLLTGSIDHTIRLWDAADGTCLQIERHVDPVVSVALLEGDSQLVAGDRGGSVHVWQRRPKAAAAAAESQPLHSWKAHQGRVWDVDAIPGRPGVLTAGADGKIHYWQRPPAAERSFDAASGHTIDDVAFESGTTRLHVITSPPDDRIPEVQMWDIASGRQSPLQELLADARSPTATEPARSSGRRPLALCMLPGHVLVLGCSDGTIESLELPTGKRRFRLQVPWNAGTSNPLTDLAVSRDGRRLAVFCFAENKTAVYDLMQNRLLGTFEAYAHGMALSDDGSRLAMSDGDDVVVCNVDQPRERVRLQGHTSSVAALEFHPGGRYLASGSKDRQLRLWDLQSGAASTVLAGHRAAVQAIAFSPDGRLLASGDERGELKFWFLPQPAELISIDQDMPIHKLVFSADGNRLAVQTPQQIRILNARPGGSGDRDTAAAW